MKIKYTSIILSIVLCYGLESLAQTGCTDPLANNYDVTATNNDGSCTYNAATISPTSSTSLNATLNETSGLILWEDEIWTHTDGGNPTELYNINVSDLTSFSTLNIPGTTNEDWEDIAQDDNYVYIGDFGNNAQGNRQDLKIYRIEKNSILAESPVVDEINFSYSDQTDFSDQGGNNTDFDCEALIVTDTSIYLFTKEWVSQETTIYSLPKTPGTYSATNEGSYNVNGLITGATYAKDKQLVVLSGYSSILQPFLVLLYDFTGNNFFNGNKRKINLNLPFHQVEGIATQDGINYFASNERVVNFITIQPKIHELDLAVYLLNYLGYETSGNSLNFSQPTAWVPGNVPPEGSEIKIAHDLNLDQNYTAVNAEIKDDITLTTNANFTLSIQNNLKLETNSNLIFEPNSILDVDGNITNEGTLYFESDATGTAQFDEFTGTISGSGEVSVERFIPAGDNNKRAFRLLSTAVNSAGSVNANWQEGATSEDIDPNPNPGFGTHITGGTVADGFDQNATGNPSMFTFDNNFVPTGTQTQDNAWIPLENTNEKTLLAGEPYLTLIRGDRSIDLTDNSSTPTNTRLRTTGNLHTGVLDFELNPEHELYSLVGNPYQAVVDFNAVETDDLTNFIYIWDASIGGINGKGGYVSVELPAGDETVVAPGIGISDASQYLAPGMSFFVQNLSSSSTEITGTFSPTLVFNEEDKATGENQVTVFEDYPHFYLNSQLYKTIDLLDGNTASDAIGLRFADNYTSIANDEDATKLDNPHEMYAVINNGLRSIDKQQLPAQDHKIDLSITNYTATDYSLSFVMGNKPADLSVFLKDEYLDSQTEITNGFVYDFSVDSAIPESLDEQRFSLVFNPETLGGEDFLEITPITVLPNPAKTNHIYLNIPETLIGKQANIELFDYSGRLLLQTEIKTLDKQEILKIDQLSSGLYILKIQANGIEQSLKLSKI